AFRAAAPRRRPRPHADRSGSAATRTSRHGMPPHPRHEGGTPPANVMRVTETLTSIDPVCGRPIVQAEADASLTSEYADITYRFCSAECMERFTEQPDVFVAQPGSGQTVGHDRARRTDDDRGELKPGQHVELTNSPPTPGPG